MNGTSIGILIVLAAVIGWSLYRTIRRSRRGSACCGEREAGVRRTGPVDRNKSHYPCCTEVEITGMTCDNCAAKVENTLNALDGVWATVRIDTKKARILSEQPISERVLRETLQAIGYGVGQIGECRQKNGNSPG